MRRLCDELEDDSSPKRAMTTGRRTLGLTIPLATTSCRNAISNCERGRCAPAVAPHEHSDRLITLPHCHTPRPPEICRSWASTPHRPAPTRGRQRPPGWTHGWTSRPRLRTRAYPPTPCRRNSSTTPRSCYAPRWPHTCPRRTSRNGWLRSWQNSSRTAPRRMPQPKLSTVRQTLTWGSLRGLRGEGCRGAARRLRRARWATHRARWVTLTSHHLTARRLYAPPPQRRCTRRRSCWSGAFASQRPWWSASSCRRPTGASSRLSRSAARCAHPRRCLNTSHWEPSLEIDR